MPELNSKVALEKIQETELRAKSMEEEAKREALELLGQARLAKEGLLKTAQEKARLDAEKLKAKNEEEAGGEAAEIRAKAQAEALALKQAAEANLDVALRWVKAKL